MLIILNYANILKKIRGEKHLDLSTLNFSTILTLAISMALAYVAVKIVSGIISRIICMGIGIILLVIVLNNFGVSVPLLGEILNYTKDMIGVVMGNVKDLLSIV